MTALHGSAEETNNYVSLARFDNAAVVPGANGYSCFSKRNF